MTPLSPRRHVTGFIYKLSIRNTSMEETKRRRLGLPIEKPGKTATYAGIAKTNSGLHPSVSSNPSSNPYLLTFAGLSSTNPPRSSPPNHPLESSPRNLDQKRARNLSLNPLFMRRSNIGHYHSTSSFCYVRADAVYPSISVCPHLDAPSASISKTLPILLATSYTSSTTSTASRTSFTLLPESPTTSANFFNNLTKSTPAEKFLPSSTTASWPWSVGG
ncbi:hypothetical protein C1H76_1674 [Elsinoe australis]|uniref:Uncharacterized protein n=1 Tax=Elsinoe australis TaxID=40998 RepID=A0A4U7B3Z4_9PEZI|nr:hypothetical protein C1H76_1674 [Elsinoe australis]